MKTLQEQYNLIKEGKGNKAYFLKTALRQFPDMLSPVNTFEDTVTILKNRSIINEGIGGLVTSGKKQDWQSIFNDNMATLKEEKEAKAEEKETTKKLQIWLLVDMIIKTRKIMIMYLVKNFYKDTTLR